MHEKQKSLGTASIELSEKDADELEEINTLHAAIARAISVHHFGDRWFNLPTKDGKLDWSLGERWYRSRRRPARITPSSRSCATAMRARSASQP